MKRAITYGTFAILHFGHINLPKHATALGDYLSLQYPQMISTGTKKHTTCYFSYERRKALVEAIRYVDLVISEENWEQKRSCIHEYHIDTFVIGEDRAGKFDYLRLREERAEVVYLSRTPVISSEQIKKYLYDTNAVNSNNISVHAGIDVNPCTE